MDLQALAKEARQGTTFEALGSLRAVPWSSSMSIEARAEISAHPSLRSYLTLMVLREREPGAYARVEALAAAQVLCDALARQPFLDDWGYLDEEGGHEGEATWALIELGPAAIPPLAPCLRDRTRAYLSGSERATMAELHGLRRCDLAARAMARLLGLPPRFDRDVDQRDRWIAQLEQSIP